MRKKGFIIAAILLLATGCTGIQVSQDYDPTTDFRPLKTYTWASSPQPATGDPRIDNPLQDNRIRTAVERFLTARGFIHTRLDRPTFRLRYTYVIRQRMTSAGSGGAVSLGIGGFGRHGGIAVGTGTGSALAPYDEVSLVIDVLAGDSDRLLWRGTGTQPASEPADPAAATAAMEKLVETLLAQFPPEPS